MLHKYSLKAANYLIKHNSIESKDLSMYTYGFELIFSAVINIFFILIIGAILKQFIYAIIFLITFTLLRHFVGGYHCNTFLKCFCTTNCINLLMLIMLYIPENVLIYISLALAIIGFPIILRLAPQVTPDRIIGNMRRSKIYGNITAILILFYALFAIKLGYFQEAFTACYSLFVVALFLIILKRRLHL